MFSGLSAKARKLSVMMMEPVSEWYPKKGEQVREKCCFTQSCLGHYQIGVCVWGGGGHGKGV